MHNLISNKKDALTKRYSITIKNPSARLGMVGFALLPLYACSGGGTSPTTSAPPPPPPPEPDFIESPTNTFTARDDNNRVLSEASATTNLTVTGKGGNDTITTGSGNDVINGGDGKDTINAGSGIDIIDGGNDVYYDKISYATSPAGVTINLEQGTASGGDAEGDTIINIEWVAGSPFDDNITGTQERNILRGGDGNDILNGLGGWDSLYGGQGEDTLNGGAGDDVFIWDENGAFTDHIDGGDDYDTLTFDTDSTRAYFDLANMDLTNIEAIHLWRGTHSLTISSTDIIRVTDSDNTLNIVGNYDGILTISDSGWAIDSIVTNQLSGYLFVFKNGATTMAVSSQIEMINAPAIEKNFVEGTPDNFTALNDFDSILYRPNANNDLTITGKGGDDSIVTGSGNDTIFGGAGNDTIITGWGNNDISGGSGEDKLYGNDLDDTINGGDGNDEIWGRGGNDIISGGAGDDYIYAAYSNSTGDNMVTNVVNGNSGDDTLIGSDGNDTLNGGAGSDAIGGIAGDNLINGGTGDDFLSGGTGNDTINGGADNDYLSGQEGNDILNGGDGDDTLDGGEGDDILNGGNGNDRLYYRDSGDSFDGGNGRDTLNLDTTAIELDLSTITAINIEKISIIPAQGTDLTLSLQDVIDTTDLNNLLIIDGDASDSVNSTGQNWVQGADQAIESQLYHSYTSGTGTLLVEVDIIQDIS